MRVVGRRVVIGVGRVTAGLAGGSVVDLRRDVTEGIERPGLPGERLRPGDGGIAAGRVGLVEQELLEVQARFSRDSESYRRHWSSTGEPLAPWVSAI